MKNNSTRRNFLTKLTAGTIGTLAIPVTPALGFKKPGIIKPEKDQIEKTHTEMNKFHVQQKILVTALSYIKFSIKYMNIFIFEREITTEIMLRRKDHVRWQYKTTTAKWHGKFHKDYYREIPGNSYSLMSTSNENEITTTVEEMFEKIENYDCLNKLSQYHPNEVVTMIIYFNGKIIGFMEACNNTKIKIHEINQTKINRLNNKKELWKHEDGHWKFIVRRK